jgi:hypothetical protein
VASDLLKERFVCVTVNNHNGGNNPDGGDGFLSKLACPYGNYHHVATADGKVLYGGSLSGVNQDVVGALRGALNAFDALPESERKPGAIKVPEPTEPTRQGLIQPPKGGLILRVYQRGLKRDAKGEVARITHEDVKDRQMFPDEPWRWANAIMTEPMPDVMWLTEAEWKSLVPADAKKGDRFDVPRGIKMRLLRYHLYNGTAGLIRIFWYPGDVIRGELTLTVEEVSPILRLRLRGVALMASSTEVDKAERGYDTKLTGVLEYDPSRKALTRFDFVSVGDWWGGDNEGNRFARPGKTPLGIAFELAKGNRVSDFVPPKGGPFKDLAKNYFAAEREP